MPDKRKSIHVEGVQHGAPIPMGAVVGNFLFSSAIGGIDPATGQTPPGLEEQCRLAFANMKTLVENAGGSLDDIGSVKVYMRDRSRRDAVNRPWLEMFPDEAARPARHAIEYDGFPPASRYNWKSQRCSADKPVPVTSNSST